MTWNFKGTERSLIRRGQGRAEKVVIKGGGDWAAPARPSPPPKVLNRLLPDRLHLVRDLIRPLDVEDAICPTKGFPSRRQLAVKKILDRELEETRCIIRHT